MKVAIAANDIFDVSPYSHVELTEALNTSLFDTEAGQASVLRLRFGQASEFIDFPVRAIWRGPSTESDESQSLNIGTLTLRHVDYDAFVDRYLIRDNETRHRSSFQIATLAKERMSEILSDSFFDGGGRINIYQTGLESLVIGLYHAVALCFVQRVNANMPALQIQPVYHTSAADSAKGSIWQSPQGTNHGRA